MQARIGAAIGPADAIALVVQHLVAHMTPTRQRNKKIGVSGYVAQVLNLRVSALLEHLGAAVGAPNALALVIQHLVQVAIRATEEDATLKI